MKKNKNVYVGFSAEFIHEGHINILKIASKLGNVTVGLLTDKAIASYKAVPYLTYEKRKLIIKNIKNFNKIIPQNTLDYTYNLLDNIFLILLYQIIQILRYYIHKYILKFDILKYLKLNTILNKLF